jgi:hypothetical protein
MHDEEGLWWGRIAPAEGFDENEREELTGTPATRATCCDATLAAKSGSYLRASVVPALRIDFWVAFALESPTLTKSLRAYSQIASKYPCKNYEETALLRLVPGDRLLRIQLWLRVRMRLAWHEMQGLTFA